MWTDLTSSEPLNKSRNLDIYRLIVWRLMTPMNKFVGATGVFY